MGRTPLVLVLLVTLAGCSRIAPSDPGLHAGYPLTGQTAKTASGLQVSFSDGLGFTCSGPFAVPAGQKTVTARITCADGRDGIAVIELAAGGKPKTAVLKLGPGDEETAVFGTSVSFPAEAADRSRARGASPKKRN